MEDEIFPTITEDEVKSHNTTGLGAGYSSRVCKRNHNMNNTKTQYPEQWIARQISVTPSNFLVLRLPCIKWGNILTISLIHNKQKRSGSVDELSDEACRGTTFEEWILKLGTRPLSCIILFLWCKIYLYKSLHFITNAPEMTLLSLLK